MLGLRSWPPAGRAGSGNPSVVPGAGGLFSVVAYTQDPAVRVGRGATLPDPQAGASAFRIVAFEMGSV